LIVTEKDENEMKREKIASVIWIIGIVLVLILFGIMISYILTGGCPPKLLARTFIILNFSLSIFAAIFSKKIRQYKKLIDLITLIAIILVAIFAIFMFIFISDFK